MKRIITGRQVAAGFLTIVAIAGLCCLMADSPRGAYHCDTAFYLTKIIGLILVPGAAGLGANLARRKEWV